ncbi:MAG: hypothetical protein ACRD0L_02980 [Acidimicrobiales bacterium]
MTRRRRLRPAGVESAGLWGDDPAPPPGAAPDSIRPAPDSIRPAPDSTSPAPDHTRAAPDPIRPTPDPTGLLRSLGPPPLSTSPGVAFASLAVAYEEVVRAATALAAAGGILAEEPVEEA